MRTTLRLLLIRSVLESLPVPLLAQQVQDQLHLVLLLAQSVRELLPLPVPLLAQIKTQSIVCRLDPTSRVAWQVCGDNHAHFV